MVLIGAKGLQWLFTDTALRMTRQRWGELWPGRNCSATLAFKRCGSSNTTRIGSGATRDSRRLKCRRAEERALRYNFFAAPTGDSNSKSVWWGSGAGMGTDGGGAALEIAASSG